MTGDLELTPGEVSIEAERTLLGALMEKPSIAETVWALVTPDMFWHPRHSLLASVLHHMANSGRAIDPATVVSYLLTEGKVEQVGGGAYIHTLWTNSYNPDNAPYWANSIRDAWERRQLRIDTRRYEQMTTSPAFTNDELRLALAELADKHVEAAAPPVPVGGQTIVDLLERIYPRVTLIPGLLNRRNRYMYTGGEGVGKSELAAQMACCSVAGLHPFGGEDYRPLRVQIIDAENDGYQSQVRFRRILPLVEKNTPRAIDWTNLFIENRPEGLSLLKPENVTWVKRVLDVSRPDLLVIGSFYKLYRGANVNDETAAGQVTDVLDDLRIRYDTAVLIEAHSGKDKDQMGRRVSSPRGSSAFMGWPEFGHGYQRSEDDPGGEYAELIDVLRWRGNRVPDMYWPYQLRRGVGDELPWVPPSDDEIEMFRYRAREARKQQRGAA